MTSHTPIYAGIENEFQLMREKERFYISDGEFNDLLREYGKPYFKKAPTAIRTCVGSAIYIDENEPEVSTPPIALEKGIATKITDMLYLARRELVNFFKPRKDLELIGYSMHWNISKFSDEKLRPSILESMAVPYSLFCLNPASIGTALIIKAIPNRWEWRGDHIFEENQIKAFLTLFIGTMSCFEANQKYLPMRYAEESGNEIYSNLVRDGRESKILITREEKDMFMSRKRTWKKEITAQDYLETYYDFFKKGIEEVATREEMRNLEDFISGKKKLEVDKKEKYKLYSELKKDEGYLKYDKRFIMPASYFQNERPLPSKMAKHLTRYNNIEPVLKRYIRQTVKGFPFKVENLEWRMLDFFEYKKNDDDKSYKKNYLFAETLYYDILEDLLNSMPKKKHKKILRQLCLFNEMYSSFEKLTAAAKGLASSHFEPTQKKQSLQGMQDIGLIKLAEGSKEPVIETTPTGQKIAKAILGLKVLKNSFLNNNFQLSEEQEKKMAIEEEPGHEEKKEEPVTKKKNFFRRLCH
ncbi:hypothetical protein JW756_06335 [Candidatus Woesearchaeota archaeon]|nr:hypothetical protein [Candidatus Woesearchaeota archaeon]